MSKVLEDEIGHVRHGVVWFDRWRQETDAFEALQSALPPGLDVVRARGADLCTEPRLRAGLSATFIQSLRLHRAGKGRRPRLWVFWPDVEGHCVGRNQVNGHVSDLGGDLAQVFGLLGSNDDLVVSARPPSPEYTERLARVGLPTPKSIETIEAAGPLKPDEVLPWGWSPQVRRNLKGIETAVRCSFPEHDDDRRLHRSLVLKARERFRNEGLLAEDRVGSLFLNILDLERYLESTGPTLLKAPYSSSGRRRRVVRHSLEAADRAWVSRLLKSDGSIFAEPYMPRLADFGLVLPTVGRPSLLRFFTDKEGAYRGHLLASPTHRLPSALALTMASFPEGGMKGLVHRVSEAARSAVSYGPVGVDLLIEQREDGPALHPLVEFNGRFTMGHIALALKQHLAPGSIGLWWHVRRSDLKVSGIQDFTVLSTLWPEPSVRTIGSKAYIESGVIPTNNPAQACVVVTVLSVAKDLNRAIEQLAPLEIHPETLQDDRSAKDVSSRSDPSMCTPAGNF